MAVIWVEGNIAKSEGNIAKSEGNKFCTHKDSDFTTCHCICEVCREEDCQCCPVCDRLDCEHQKEGNEQ